MRFYARFACGNPHFHTSWYKISYDILVMYYGNILVENHVTYRRYVTYPSLLNIGYPGCYALYMKLAVKTVQDYIYIYNVYWYICTVLTIWHLPKRQLPNVSTTDDVRYLSVSDITIRCKRSVCMSMMTVLKVSSKGFCRDFICMHYTILRLSGDRILR